MLRNLARSSGSPINSSPRFSSQPMRRAMRAAGALRRQIPADAAASQLGKAGRPAFPLLPGDGAQPTPGPLVKIAQHRRGLAEAEVAAPSDEIGLTICARLLPRVRRVSSLIRPRNRATAWGAMRRRGRFPYVKLKPRNLRVLGRATALLALLTFSLRRLVRNLSTLAITRAPAH